MLLHQWCQLIDDVFHRHLQSGTVQKLLLVATQRTVPPRSGKWLCRLRNHRRRTQSVASWCRSYHVSWWPTIQSIAIYSLIFYCRKPGLEWHNGLGLTSFILSVLYRWGRFQWYTGEVVLSSAACVRELTHFSNLSILPLNSVLVQTFVPNFDFLVQ